MSRLRKFSSAAIAAGALLALASTGVAAASGPSSAAPHSAVYTLSNSTAAGGGNAVLAFHRGANGALSPIGSYATGGAGNGGSLGSQGAVVLTNGDRRLIAVNAGSNTVSAFAVAADGALTWLDTESSGGTTPISVTAHDGVVYVLNTDSNSIAGLRLVGDDLRPISDSVRSLSAAASGPAEIAFSPNGRHLVVTEKNTNTIDTFNVGPFGRTSFAVQAPSDASTPFGFAFDAHGHAIVSDASVSALSSYRVTGSGAQIVNTVPDTQAAACWVAIFGSNAYTTNAASGTVSRYSIAADGTLTLTSAVAATAAGHPSDEAFGGTVPRLWIIENTGQRIVSAPVGPNGFLGASTTSLSGLPASAAGIAATAA